ncbi:MAG: RsmB/NOP family class I SAM-dependent RNA methyltransferase [Clostridia bacterium]|nr:RsmB/NOP family class I SAM-dependent RNA methyltransferase [Clostridia bacterium]
MDMRIPAYLREALVRDYGESLADEIAAGFAVRRPVTLRLNPLKGDPAETEALLRTAGFDPQPVDWYPDARILPGCAETDVQALEVYKEGRIYLQSLSAMLPALLMPLKPGMSVLDMCAAPGGKSTQMAALAAGRIDLTCCERDAVRADRLRYNLGMQGVRRAVVMNTDARQLDPMFRFDAVLLDAPCTGSGTILLGDGNPPRRMEPAWVQKTVKTQAALMKKAVGVLKPGGTMVYATCSVLREENEGIVRAALSAGLNLVPVPESLHRALPTLPVTIPGTLCIRPTELCEGFFAAALTKPAQ